MSFFFFQAEDGIRDVAVTGVQTCALPICPWRSHPARVVECARPARPPAGCCPATARRRPAARRCRSAVGEGRGGGSGRASGRGRGEISGGAVSLKKKK